MLHDTNILKRIEYTGKRIDGHCVRVETAHDACTFADTLDVMSVATSSSGAPLAQVSLTHTSSSGAPLAQVSLTHTSSSGAPLAQVSLTHSYLLEGLAAECLPVEEHPVYTLGAARLVWRQLLQLEACET
jgi:hypothetical protein